MNIGVFENQLFGQVKKVNDETGNVWLLVRDVCTVLEYKDLRDAVKRYVNPNDKKQFTIETAGGMQNMSFINIQGVYDLCLHSRMPRAREFQNWITHEVLVDIRNYGMYIADNPGVGNDAICNDGVFTPDQWTKEKFNHDLVKYQQEILAKKAINEYLQRELDKNRDFVIKLEKINDNLRKSYNIYRNVNSTFTTENIKSAQYQDIISNQYPVRVAIENFFDASEFIGFGDRYDLFMKFLVDCEICVYVENMNLITPSRLSVYKGWFDYTKEFNGIMYYSMSKFAMNDFARYVKENNVIENMTSMVKE